MTYDYLKITADAGYAWTALYIGDAGKAAKVASAVTKLQVVLEDLGGIKSGTYAGPPLRNTLVVMLRNLMVTISNAALAEDDQALSDLEVQLETLLKVINNGVTV